MLPENRDSAPLYIETLLVIGVAEETVGFNQQSQNHQRAILQFVESYLRFWANLDNDYAREDFFRNLKDIQEHEATKVLAFKIALQVQKKARAS